MSRLRLGQLSSVVEILTKRMWNWARTERRVGDDAARVAHRYTSFTSRSGVGEEESSLEGDDRDPS